MASKTNYNDGLPTNFNGPKSKPNIKEHSDNLAFGTNFDLVYKHPDCEEDTKGLTLTQPMKMLIIKHAIEPDIKHVPEPTYFFGDSDEDDYVSENYEGKHDVNLKKPLYFLKNRGAVSIGTAAVLCLRKRKVIHHKNIAC